MHRIDTPTAQVGKFGVGKNGFTAGNPQTGELPTALDQTFFDSIQEEICTVIEGASVALNKSSRNQLLTALKKLFLQTGSNLSEIKASGEAAMAETRSNLRLGSAALRNVTTTDTPDPSELIDVLHADGRFLWKDANGSDIPNKPLFRQRLGLGSASLLDTGTSPGNIPTVSITDSKYLTKVAADSLYLTQSAFDASGYSVFRTQLANGKVLIKQSGLMTINPGLQNTLNLPVSMSQVITSASVTIVDADPAPDRTIGISPQTLNLVYIRNWSANSIKVRWTVEGI